MGITIVLSHSHCTIRITQPPDNSPLPVLPLCLHWQCICPAPCSDTPAVQAWRWSPASHRAKRTRGNECPLPESLLLSPAQPAVHSDQSGAWAPATEEISYLFIPGSSSRSVSNQTQCVLLYPASVLLCRPWAHCTGSGHISAGSTSHGNISLIEFCSSILPYLQLHPTTLRAAA